VTLRLLVLFLAIAESGVYGQDVFPGLYGKITSRPKAGDLAPEITFAKVLHTAAADPWTAANLSGHVTVLFPFPYVSGNPNLVDQWNTLVGQFAGKPVQFVWIAGEEESTLLPFLQNHPMKGWVFYDPDNSTGRSYGLEEPQAIIIGVDRRISGFDRSRPLPSEEVINAVLDDHITLTPPKPTLEDLKAFSESGHVLLSPQPERMSQPDDHRPDFSPSYAVHIAPAHDPVNGGDFAAADYLSLQGYTLKRLLSRILDLNPIRIDLAASIDTTTRYDVAIVLPKPEDDESKRSLIRKGVEEYFHLATTSENRLRDVYVLTAPDRKPPASKVDALAGGGWISSMSFDVNADPNGFPGDPSHSIDAIRDVGLSSTTIDEFCKMLERDLDRPIADETKLDGKFDFEVKDPAMAGQQRPKGDFVQRLREQMGLVIAPAQRYVETIVYRLR
jgi:uncharacterized protein (TIGR03435 family)